MGERIEWFAMAKSIEAYLDNRGSLHMTATSAIIADLAAALGRVGEEGGLTEGVARLILEKREEIERAFADYDALDMRKSVRIDHSATEGINVLNLEKKRS